MRNIHIKSNSHILYENGVMSKDSPIQAKRDVLAICDERNSNIYHVCVKDSVNENYIIEPKPMKIAKEEMTKLTLEGLAIDDPNNKWGIDFSNYGIQFIKNIMFEWGSGNLLVRDRNELICHF